MARSPASEVDKAVATGGLFLNGRILARSKRAFQQPDGTMREVKTYRVLAGIDLFYVDDWSSETPMSVGATLEAPVSLRAFKGRNGEPQARLNFVRANEVWENE
jgi:hypothetical protein